MTQFWKNDRYTTFEKNIATGDTFRGLPANQFPWTIVNKQLQDEENDMWQLEVTCKSLETEKVGNNVKVVLIAHAQCLLLPLRVRELGFSPERLEWLGINIENIIVNDFEITKRIKFEQIEAIGKNHFEKLREYIFKSHNYQQKIKYIREAIDKQPSSRFAEHDA